jgi:hypothetical protein
MACDSHNTWDTISQGSTPQSAHTNHEQFQNKNDNGLLSSTRLGFCWVSDCRQFTKVWALPQASLKMKLGRCHKMLLETENSAHRAIVLTCPQVTTWQVMWLSSRWSKLFCIASNTLSSLYLQDSHQMIASWPEHAYLLLYTIFQCIHSRWHKTGVFINTWLCLLLF